MGLTVNDFRFLEREVVGFVCSILRLGPAPLDRSCVHEITVENT